MESNICKIQLIGEAVLEPSGEKDIRTFSFGLQYQPTVTKITAALGELESDNFTKTTSDVDSGDFGTCKQVPVNSMSTKFFKLAGTNQCISLTCHVAACPKLIDLPRIEWALIDGSVSISFSTSVERIVDALEQGHWSKVACRVMSRAKSMLTADLDQILSSTG